MLVYCVGGGNIGVFLTSDPVLLEGGVSEEGES